jgi:hypothetical protein
MVLFSCCLKTQLLMRCLAFSYVLLMLLWVVPWGLSWVVFLLCWAALALLCGLFHLSRVCFYLNPVATSQFRLHGHDHSGMVLSSFVIGLCLTRLVFVDVLSAQRQVFFISRLDFKRADYHAFVRHLRVSRVMAG